MNNLNLRCLYIHDHKFKVEKDKFYSEGKITDNVFLRYIDSQDSLTVLSRLDRTSSIDGLTEITLKNVEFSPVSGISFSKIFTRHLLTNIKTIWSNNLNSDFLIVRLPSFIGIFALIVNTIHKKKYFVEVVGDPKEALISLKENSNLFFNVFVIIFSKLNKYCISKATGVIYVTEFTLQKRYPTKGLTSYASNVEISIKEKFIKYEDYKTHGEKFKIGLIGSFNNYYKGITEAINALSLLNNSEKNIELHILGSGTLKDHYKSLAKELGVNDLVFFDGTLKGGHEVASWLKSLDLYIQPSYTEGLPRALIEAMSVGLPAVASNVGGIPELLSKDTLIKPYDSEALAKKIKDFVDSQQLRFEQGKLNYQKAKEYDQNVLKKRRSEFWQSARDIVKRSLV